MTSSTTHEVHYEQIVDDLTYTYDGVFTPAEVREAVATARTELEPGAKFHVYLPVLVNRRAVERLKAAARADGRLARPVPELLFLCVQNAGRSQLAAGLAEHLSGGRVHVRTAGSRPADSVNPDVVTVLAERGIDISHAYPKPLVNDVVHAADVVVTMGCGDACPVYDGKRYDDWPIDDPNGQPLAKVRRIADDIEVRVISLLRELGIEPSAEGTTGHPEGTV